jgi:hypothetical protein
MKDKQTVQGVPETEHGMIQANELRALAGESILEIGSAID